MLDGGFFFGVGDGFGATSTLWKARGTLAVPMIWLLSIAMTRHHSSPNSFGVKSNVVGTMRAEATGSFFGAPWVTSTRYAVAPATGAHARRTGAGSGPGDGFLA